MKGAIKYYLCDLLFAFATVLFIVLKLCGAIDWPWFLVLAPVWVIMILGVVCFVVALIIHLIEYKEEREKQ